MLRYMALLLILAAFTPRAHSSAVSDRKAKQDCSEANIRLMYAERRYVKRNPQYREVFAPDWREFKWACSTKIVVLKQKYRLAKAAKRAKQQEVPAPGAVIQQAKPSALIPPGGRAPSPPSARDTHEEFADPRDALPPPLN
jgi:hypothetical protein